MGLAEVEAEIINIVKDPKHPGRKIVTLKLNDADGEYNLSFSIVAKDNTPISLEQLAVDLGTRDLSRPINPYAEIEAAAKDRVKIKIKPTPPVPPTQ